MTIVYAWPQATAVAWWAIVTKARSTREPGMSLTVITTQAPRIIGKIFSGLHNCYRLHSASVISCFICFMSLVSLFFFFASCLCFISCLFFCVTCVWLMNFFLVGLVQVSSLFQPSAHPVVAPSAPAPVPACLIYLPVRSNSFKPV